MQKVFITTKVVQAKEMMAIEAEQLNYKTNDLPSETLGYEVTYEDGYKSWCPKNVFDKNAIELQELSIFNVQCKDSMPEYLKRIFEEHNNLQDKINKLLAFVKTESFDELDKTQKENLNKQKVFMLGYLNVLRERILYEIIPTE